jgi:hypothetical protein
MENKQGVTYLKKKVKNRYDLSGEFGIGWTSNTNQKFYFDLNDYEKIKDYTWFEHIRKDGYHLLEAWDSSLGCKVKMWHVLGYKYHDHINRNTLDNRSVNLRPATASENARNGSTRSNNTSGITGLRWRKNQKKWEVSIQINNKRLWLGSFENKDDAIRARLQAEADYYGEFSPQQHLFEQYNIITKQND